MTLTATVALVGGETVNESGSGWIAGHRGRCGGEATGWVTVAGAAEGVAEPTLPCCEQRVCTPTGIAQCMSVRRVCAARAAARHE